MPTTENWIKIVNSLMEAEQLVPIARTDIINSITYGLPGCILCPLEGATNLLLYTLEIDKADFFC